MIFEQGVSDDLKRMAADDKERERQFPALREMATLERMALVQRVEKAVARYGEKSRHDAAMETRCEWVSSIGGMIGLWLGKLRPRGDYQQGCCDGLRMLANLIGEVEGLCPEEEPE